MKQEIKATHNVDDGGVTEAEGLTILWQSGPLGRGEERQEPNGTFVETVIAAAINRLRHYQSSKFKCSENASAIRYLNDALHILDLRTIDRERRGVEGTDEA